jgi:hypothetical protein
VARIVQEKCPRCGAQLQLAPNIETVQCHYCGHQSVIQWPNRKPSVQVQQWQIDPAWGRIAVTQASRGAGAAIALFAILPVFIIAGVSVAIAVSTHRTPRPPPPITIPDFPVGPAADPAKPTGSKMDIADLVKQAKTTALATEPHATKFSSAVCFQVQGGLVDTGQMNACSIDFSFRFQDSSKPPGKDMNEGSVMVHVANGAMTPQTMNAFYKEKDLAIPTCSSKDAWAAAVKSGVPDNAIATMHIYDNSPFSPKAPTVWSVRVDGHDEYRREIDVTNCAVVKNWGKK